MDEILEGFSSNASSFRLNRTDRRLLGWLKMRLVRSPKTPWIHLSLPSFCKATGIGLRTAKRSLQKLRLAGECELVARTINEKGRWRILASTTTRLHGLKRSEPFDHSKSGAKRVIKTHLKGEIVHHQQLVLGESPVLWKAQAQDKDKEEHKEEKPFPGHPNQTKIDFSQACPGKLGKQSDRVPVFHLKRINHVNQSKRDFVGFGENSRRKLRRLAFAMARHDLKEEHWDNCKVRHSYRHAFNYAVRELEAGCNRKTITKAYELALRSVHAQAVDQGVVEPNAWEPSSTVCRARGILAENGCRGQWWIANQMQQVR